MARTGPSMLPRVGRRIRRMALSILEPMPAPVEAKVEQLLDEGEQPRVSACTDMDAEGHFRGAWLVATERRLLIVAPETDGAHPRKSLPARPRRRAGAGTRLADDAPRRPFLRRRPARR